MECKVWTKFHCDTPGFPKPRPAQTSKAPIHCREQLASIHTISLVCLVLQGKAFCSSLLHTICTFSPESFLSKTEETSSVPTSVGHVTWLPGQWLYKDKQMKIKFVLWVSAPGVLCPLHPPANRPVLRNIQLQGDTRGMSYSTQRWCWKLRVFFF